MEFLNYAAGEKPWEWTKLPPYAHLTKRREPPPPPEEVLDRPEFIEIRRQSEAMQLLIDATREELREPVNDAPLEPTTPIDAPSNTGLVLEEYRMSYFSKVATDIPLRRILDPVWITRRYNPTVFVLQAGKRHFGDEGAAVVITLFRTGTLDTWIENSERRRVKWASDKTVTFLARGSYLESFGSGRVACLVIGYQHARPQASPAMLNMKTS